MADAPLRIGRSGRPDPASSPMAPAPARTIPWMTRVAQGLDGRGVQRRHVQLPLHGGAAGSVPDPRRGARSATLQEVWTRRGARRDADACSPAASRWADASRRRSARRRGFDPAPAGLVFFGYPLHPPGKPAQRRDKHLPQITAPMLFLHGTRDPFGSPDEMRELVAGLRGADARAHRGRRSFARAAEARGSAGTIRRSRPRRGRGLDDALKPARGGGAKFIGPLVPAGKPYDFVRHLLRRRETPRRPPPSPA